MTIRHGTRLGVEHRSVRQHLIEDHGMTPEEARRLSDGGVHGWHDGDLMPWCSRTLPAGG